MKIDQHLFPRNMVDVGGKKNPIQTKVLTSQSARESRVVDPKAQVSAMKSKGRSRKVKLSALRHHRRRSHPKCCLKNSNLTMKDNCTEKKLHNAMRGIGGVLCLCTIGRKD